MGVDQNGEHALRLVQFDEPHPAHVGRQIVNPVHSLHGLVTSRQFPQIQGEVLYVVTLLVPLPKRLEVHRPDVFDSLLAEVRHQMPPDESPGPGNENVTFRMCGFAHEMVLEGRSNAFKVSPPYL